VARASDATRPALRLVAADAAASASAAAPTLARDAATAAAGPSRGSAIGRRTAPTNAARLAEATGARLSDDGEAGTETVVFPRPAGASFAPAVALMRDADDALGSEDQSAGQAPAQTAAQATSAPPVPQPGSGGRDIDEIYDQVMQRLRRDLLADRERMGDLLGDLP
jgi:hypothetical protein